MLGKRLRRARSRTLPHCQALGAGMLSGLALGRALAAAAAAWSILG